jgi:hypothetical protein
MAPLLDSCLIAYCTVKSIAIHYISKPLNQLTPHGALPQGYRKTVPTGNGGRVLGIEPLTSLIELDAFLLV